MTTSTTQASLKPHDPALPPSYEVLRDACKEVGVKNVAVRVGVSAALAYKWTEAPPSANDPGAPGTSNPLSRTLDICDATQLDTPVEWLAAKRNGFFVKNPEAPRTMEERDRKLCEETGELLTNFSDLLRAIVNSGAEIDAEETLRIRAEAEELKSDLEAFVVCCERGYFGGR